MASKTKLRNMKNIKKEPIFLLITASLFVAFIALMQNKYGQFSDVRGFYGMHFYDGQHRWPYSESYTPIGAKDPLHAVEYPVLTGLVMWLISFFVSPSNMAIFHYYWLTATLHIILFAISAYQVKLLSNRKSAYYFILAPAVLYSLYRNWDIWALIPMLFAIILFEKEKFNQSAFWLAVAIATKFFPIVLALPIAIIFVRKGRLKELFKYTTMTLAIWITINLPFALIDFKGWFYFYEFSYKRSVGSASIFEIISILKLGVSFPKPIFYLLNIGIFALVGIFLYKCKEIPRLAESAFFVLFAFTLFNKQYSMQYVIWLAPFAVITMYKINKNKQWLLFCFYIFWQVTELLFQYSFFQNILTNTYADTDTPMTTVVSTHTYAWIGVIRYLAVIVFTSLLAKYLYEARKPVIQGQKK